MPSHAEIEAIIRKIKYKDWNFHVGIMDSRPYLQLHFTDSSGVIRHGRKWSFSQWMTKSEIVQTAFLAVKTAEEHEARERFLYKEKAIFGPHFNVDTLHEICDPGNLDVRQAI